MTDVKQVEEFINIIENHPILLNRFQNIFNKKFVQSTELSILLNELKEQNATIREGFTRFDERFEKIDKRFEELKKDSDAKFARVDERFEEMKKDSDAKFARMDKRFEKIDKRFEELKKDSDAKFARVDERFEKMDKRFEEMKKDTDTKFQKVFEAIALNKQAIDAFSLQLSALGRRWGIGSEEAVRNGLRELFKRKVKNLKVDKWITYDTEGIVFGHPAEIEVDIHVENEEHWLIEYKARTQASDVYKLFNIGKLYKKETGNTPKLFIITAFLDKAERTAKELNVTIFTTTKDF